MESEKQKQKTVCLHACCGYIHTQLCVPAAAESNKEKKLIHSFTIVGNDSSKRKNKRNRNENRKNSVVGVLLCPSCAKRRNNYLGVSSSFRYVFKLLRHSRWLHPMTLDLFPECAHVQLLRRKGKSSTATTITPDVCCGV